MGDRTTGRLVVYSYRDLTLVLTVKDQEGRTLENVTSLEFAVKFSDDQMAQLGETQLVTGQPAPELPSVQLPIKHRQVVHPNGVRGDLDIQVSITGYRSDVLASAGVTQTPPPLPFGEEDYDDYDYDEETGEPITSGEVGVAEE